MAGRLPASIQKVQNLKNVQNPKNQGVGGITFRKLDGYDESSMKEDFKDFLDQTEQLRKLAFMNGNLQ